MQTNVPPRQPTWEEIDANAYVEEFEAYAILYPQMGGYGGKAWVRFWDNHNNEDGEQVIAPYAGGCFDVMIYHDGDFPIPEGQESERGEMIQFHACDHEQFVRFGQNVAAMEKRRREGEV